MMNTRIAVKPLVFLLLLALFAGGCAVNKTETPIRIALLAPFEGRYREIGYDAYYAAWLAIQDAAQPGVELLAVDDGGSPESAVDRAHALARDPSVRAVIALGYAATDETTQLAFGDLPVIVVGNWLVEPQSANIFMLTSPAIPAALSTTDRLSVADAARVEAPFVGGEVFALQGFRQLRADFAGIAIISSGVLPDDDFRQRIQNRFMYSAEPGLLALNVYDTLRIVMENKQPTRANIRTNLTTTCYNSNTEPICFEDNYWLNAPINTYIITSNHELISTDNSVEQRQ